LFTVIVTIHQPDHLGYLGFYHKIMNADKYVVLDTVQFAKREFIHRNRIRGAQGAMWLSVPVLTKGRYYQKIEDVEISQTESWQKQHWGRIYHAYCKAPYFDTYAPPFEAIYTAAWEKLADLNLRIIRTVFDLLGMEVDMCLASELGVEGKASELLINITQAVGGDTYLSGPGGKDYMYEDLFEERGIRLAYNQFEHPEYEQLFQPFLPYMAIIDLLFNCGPGAMDVLRNAGRNGGEA
jgi:hypothetical protein